MFQVRRVKPNRAQHFGSLLIQLRTLQPQPPPDQVDPTAHGIRQINPVAVYHCLFWSHTFFELHKSQTMDTPLFFDQLCTECTSLLEANPLHLDHFGYAHHLIIAKLRTSSTSGCRLCSLILNSILAKHERAIEPDGDSARQLENFEEAYHWLHFRRLDRDRVRLVAYANSQYKPLPISEFDITPLVSFVVFGICVVVGGALLIDYSTLAKELRYSGDALTSLVHLDHRPLSSSKLGLKPVWPITRHAATAGLILLLTGDFLPDYWTSQTQLICSKSVS